MAVRCGIMAKRFRQLDNVPYSREIVKTGRGYTGLAHLAGGPNFGPVARTVGFQDWPPSAPSPEHLQLISAGAHFSPPSTKGGEGRGEEADYSSSNPSPRPSPRSGGARELAAVRGCV